nr:unnamed protein product [Callosobruchus analis]
MNLINFHLIQNAQYIQRGCSLYLKQWSSSLALNLILLLTVAIPEVQLLLSDPIIKKILDLHSVLNKQSKSVVFVWCPGHIGVFGNESADTAARVGASQQSTPTENCPSKMEDFKSYLKAKIYHLRQMNWE